jgi:hypothetical protein
LVDIVDPFSVVKNRLVAPTILVSNVTEENDPPVRVENVSYSGRIVEVIIALARNVYCEYDDDAKNPE